MSGKRRAAITFRVGQRVVCVDATPNRLSTTKVLTRGKIYTIRAIVQGADWKPPGWGVHLEDVFIFYPDDGVEWPFNPKRFRPLKQRPTDIEIFRNLLRAE
jgi:hypothetical protein